MQNLLHDGLLRGSSTEGLENLRGSRSRRASISGRSVAELSRFLGDEHLVGCIYGLVNWIVCVPGLVSYAHIVFTQGEFESSMSELVKLYFLSSAVMQLAMTLRSSITFSIGQIQDVGLIFLAGMVRNIVLWARVEGGNLTTHEVLATSLWQCATSTILVGVCLIIIGRLQLSQYVQMLPLPVIGGYLGYIGYFCFAAGLSIGSGREINGPDTLGQLVDADLMAKLVLLGVMTVVMLIIHFTVKHFLGMPVTLLLLPIAFFVATAALGLSPEDCRAAGWLPAVQPMGSASDGGGGLLRLFDPRAVQWHFLPRQFISVLGLVIVVAFGSSLDIAAIQAEVAGQKIDYNSELTTIGIGNLFSGFVGGATGSYIFSQTIFSAKRGVRSRLNGIVVAAGELMLFFLPVDILRFLPNSYIGGIMCLFGIDIMNDWLIQSRFLMATSEYLLVWASFGCTMWLASAEVFGILEGMALGTVVASLVFVLEYTRIQVRDSWKAVRGRSSVVRPPHERRVLNAAYQSILAVSLNSFAFFGASLHMSQGIEAEAERRAARFVCLDLGRLSGMDSTATDQMRLLVLSLERMGIQVMLSSLRSKTSQRLLEAHGVVGPTVNRQVFSTLDEALQHCEEVLIRENILPSRSRSQMEQPLDKLLIEYVDGFVSHRPLAAATAQVAQAITAHFQRMHLRPQEFLIRQEEPADAIFIITAGAVRITSHHKWVANVTSPTSIVVREPSEESQMDAGMEPAPFTCRCPSDGSSPSLGRDAEDDEGSQAVGVGGIIGDTAYFAQRKFGVDAIAEESGCVAYFITRKVLEQLELSDPALVVFLQKVFLRDLSQLQVQFYGPLQRAGGLS